MTDDYFDQYSDFEFDDTASLLGEFNRLALQQRWAPKSKTYSRQKQICLVNAFSQYYGDPTQTKLSGWQSLCADVGIKPIPKSITQCRKALSKVAVNIVDLIELKRLNQKVRVFPSKAALRDYTRRTGKFFSKDAAKQDGFLKALLITMS